MLRKTKAFHFFSQLRSQKRLFRTHYQGDLVLSMRWRKHVVLRDPDGWCNLQLVALFLSGWHTRQSVVLSCVRDKARFQDHGWANSAKTIKFNSDKASVEIMELGNIPRNAYQKLVITLQKTRQQICDYCTT